jgi:DNA replication initiation complex subunit (GINS family)
LHNELYKAWKSEKTTQDPQLLPDDFYQRAAGYLKGLEDDAASTDVHAIQGHLILKEKEVARRLLEELRQTRLQKIVNATRNGKTVNSMNLTEEEKKLVASVNESLTSFKENRSPQPLHASVQEVNTELAVVRFLQDIPEIVGVDLKIYGPYKKEDVGSLPKENAQALIMQGAAIQVEVRGVP